jgi:undecaprenyl-diphosphatase
MDIFSAIILGVIQGLTEFLPISSSGHLVIAHQLLPGFSQPGILFDVIIHMGTLIAVLYYYRNRIVALNKNDIGFLVIGTVPAVLVGLFLKDYAESSFSVGAIGLGIQFIITALLCFFTDTFKKIDGKLTARNSILIGLSQAIAILPAISRSGTTIFTARALGIEKSKAAEYSFLLSVPAIVGANILQMVSYRESLIISDITPYIVGFVTAALVGYFSLSFTLRTLANTNFKWFGAYSLILGIVVILFL